MNNATRDHAKPTSNSRSAPLRLESANSHALAEDDHAGLGDPVTEINIPVTRHSSMHSGDRRQVPNQATATTPLGSGGSPPHVSARGGQSPASPVSFPDLREATAARTPAVDNFNHPGRHWQDRGPSVAGADGRPKRATVQRAPGFSFREGRQAVPPATPQRPLAPVSEEQHSPGGTATDAYSPFIDSSTVAVMNAAVAETVYDAHVARSDCSELLPITGWEKLTSLPSPNHKLASKRLPGGARMIELDVALAPPVDTSVAPITALLATLNHSLCADSPDAPDTHAEAMRRGEIWVQSEAKELNNHRVNASWETIIRDELPPGRRIHKLIWVYKVKRDGTAKSRLCVQDTTLEEGVDFQQVFSAALRHSSARAVFALAARHGCSVRSVDLVAAYLQGRFIDGEVVYCHLPAGYPKYDSKGRPKLAKVVKPIYGIQQAGRRLQRMLFEWLREQNFKPLDDSDSCIFSLTTPDGEILTIGVYVDNLQIVHSVSLDAKGRGPKGCAYNAFMDKLSTDWDVTDEGPMEDLLGIKVEHNADGSIKLHQRKYIEKVVERFLPHGPLPKAQRNSLPYSDSFLVSINDALSRADVEYPELVKAIQECLGCLMYATTSTRPDIAYPVHQLCKVMHKPTPPVMNEIDHLVSYLARNADLGLTYSREHTRLWSYHAIAIASRIIIVWARRPALPLVWRCGAGRTGRHDHVGRCRTTRLLLLRCRTQKPTPPVLQRADGQLPCCAICSAT